MVAIFVSLGNTANIVDQILVRASMFLTLQESGL